MLTQDRRKTWDKTSTCETAPSIKVLSLAGNYSTAMLSFRQTRDSVWVVVGPCTELRQGPVLVQQANGAFALVTVRSLGKPFLEGAELVVYGYIQPHPGRNPAGWLPDDLPFADVKAVTGLSQPRLQALRSSGEFPLPVARQHRTPVWRTWDVALWLGAHYNAPRSWPKLQAAYKRLLDLGNARSTQPAHPPLPAWKRQAAQVDLRWSQDRFVPLAKAQAWVPEVERLLEAGELAPLKRRLGTRTEYGCRASQLWPHLIGQLHPDWFTALLRGPAWNDFRYPWRYELGKADPDMALEVIGAALDHNQDPLQMVLALPPVYTRAPMGTPFTSWPNLPQPEPAYVPEQFRLPGETSEEARERLAAALAQARLAFDEQYPPLAGDDEAWDRSEERRRFYAPFDSSPTVTR